MIMRISKSPVSSFESPYSICSGRLGEHRVLASGSEKIGGELQLYLDPEYRMIRVAEGLGGFMAMSTADVFGSPALVTAEGLHPNFISRNAGISIYRPSEGLDQRWTRHRLADLPYIHRMTIVSTPGGKTLVAATLCGKKDHIDDWSSPGAVYAMRLHETASAYGEPPVITPILDGIVKNHGMFHEKKSDRERVYISGEEGVFVLEHKTDDEQWLAERILDRPVSELALADLDDDGFNEIVTIEPFHGDIISIYKLVEDRWEQVFQSKTELGHGIWAGKIGGAMGFVHGSRAGKRELCLYQVKDARVWKLQKTVIEGGTGSAQVVVENLHDRDLLYATNNYIDEVAVYEITP
jgi:hypothetical protein